MNREEDFEPCNPQSLLDLFKFLQCQTNHEELSVTLIPTGDFRVIWKDIRFQVTLEFLGMNNVRYVSSAFYLHKERKCRMWDSDIISVELCTELMKDSGAGFLDKLKSKKNEMVQ